MKTKCLIIGSGPAGYTAAIYAGRANLQPTLYAGLQMGGQLTQTTDIENFPGFPDGIDANEMMENFRKQAARFDADIRDGVITDVDFSQKPYVATTDRGEKIEADTIIIAPGASAKYLGLPDEKKYDLSIDGFFLAIGHKPNTDIFRGKLDMDEVGYIKTQGDTPRTNIEGVYAAGDCADPTYRQAVVAAGSGCKAALEAERYLQGK